MTTNLFRAPVILGALAFAAACGNKDDLSKDSTLGRDLALAGQDTAAKPQLTDVAKSNKAKSPATKTKSPPAPAKPSGPTSGTIAAGTTLSLSTGPEICTNHNKAGDTFTATLQQPVAGSNGVTIPVGAIVTFSITKLNRSENVNDPIEMVFVPTGIAFGGRSYAMDGSITPGFHVDKVKNNPKGTTAKNVAGGAAIGAIAGQVLGKNTKSTVIGAAIGGAVGAGAAAAATNYEGCVRSNTSVTVTLSSGLTIPVA